MVTTNTKENPAVNEKPQSHPKTGWCCKRISSKELELDKNENSSDSALTTCFIYDLVKTRSGNTS